MNRNGIHDHVNGGNKQKWQKCFFQFAASRITIVTSKEKTPKTFIVAAAAVVVAVANDDVVIEVAVVVVSSLDIIFKKTEFTDVVVVKAFQLPSFLPIVKMN